LEVQSTCSGGGGMDFRSTSIFNSRFKKSTLQEHIIIFYSVDGIIMKWYDFWDR
jgi:hypothetical protein